VLKTPDWQTFMQNGAFNQTTMKGEAFNKWLQAAEKRHYDLMSSAGFLAKK
jgi:putative tricarboxylic transport membrane protein